MTMEETILLIIGFFIGGALGFFTAAVLCAGRIDDILRRIDENERLP